MIWSKQKGGTMISTIFSKQEAEELFAYLKGYLKGGRQIPLIGQINESMITQAAGALLMMETKKVAPIELLIHTEGGNAGLLLEGIINSLQSPVDGLVIGTASSMGSIILQMCRKRRALQSAEIFCHYPSVTYTMNPHGADLIETDLRFLQSDAVAAHNWQRNLFIKRTGKTAEEVDQIFRLGDVYNLRYSAQQSLEFGLIDEIATEFKFFSAKFKGKDINNKVEKK